MKLATNTNRVFKHGDVGECGNFKIATNSKAFEILSSRIYKDPCTAVIRELSVNCLDAHISVGKEKVPITVHLPSSFEPWFSVSDEGPAMSHEDIVSLYTTYFASTKNDSDLLTGGLGIGSKSAYAISDNFSVESCYDGKKRSYAFFLNEDRCPSYTLLGVEDCPQSKTGITVQVPVKQVDFYNFQSKAAEVYRYFEVHPKLTGARINIERDKKKIEGTNWYLAENSNQNCKVIMGSIAYPVNIDNITGLDPKFIPITRHQLVLVAQIGDLDIAASREELNYNKATIANLKRYIEQVNREYSAQVQKDIDACPNFHKACIFAKRMPIKPAAANYKGRKLESSVIFTPTQPIVKFYGGYGYRSKVNENILPSGKAHAFNLDLLDYVYIKDIDKTSHSRMGELVKGKGYGTSVYLVSDVDTKALVDQIGCEEKELKLVSNVSYTPKAKADKVTGIYYLNQAFHGSSTSWVATSVDFKTEPTGYYVEFFDKHIVNNSAHQAYNKRANASEGRFVYNAARSLGIPCNKIYGVQSKKVPKFVKEKWENIIDKCRTEITALLTAQNSDFITYLAGTTSGNEWKNFRRLYKYVSDHKLKVKPDLAAFLSYVNEIDIISKKKGEIYNQIVLFDNWVDNQCGKVKISTYESLLNGMTALYPLLPDLCRPDRQNNVVEPSRIYADYLQKV